MGKRRRGRTAATTAAADLEEAASLGLALVESLGRLLVCNRFWLEREEAAGRTLGVEEVDVVKVRGGRGSSCSWSEVGTPPALLPACLQALGEASGVLVGCISCAGVPVSNM